MADKHCDGQAISNQEAFVNAGTSKGCDTNLSDYLLSIFDKVIGDVVRVIYDGLVSSNYALLLTLGALFIALRGYKIYSGQTEETMQEVLWAFVKLTMVYVLLFNYSTFHFYFYSFFVHSPHEIWGKALSLSNYHVMNSTNPNDTLDIFMTKGFALAGLASEFGGAAGYLMYAILWIGTLLITAAVFLLLVLSKVMSAVYLLLAPIFLVFWLFTLTEGIFKNWLQGLFTFWFIPVLTYAVMIFIFAVMQYPLVNISNELAVRDEIVVSDIAPVIILGVLAYWVFKRLFTFAGQLGSGVTLEAYKPVRNFVDNNVRPGVQRYWNDKVYDKVKQWRS